MEQMEIEITAVRKRYPGGTDALQGIDLALPRGTRFALLGPNGAGKSTLVRILTSLSRPDAGSVQVCGLNPSRSTAALMRLIGVANQENDLDPDETVYLHLQFQGRLFGMPAPQAEGRAWDLIELFKLEEYSGKKVRELSGGNARRLHCALALVQMTLFLTTQYLDEAEQHTEHMALLREGSICYEGSVSGFTHGLSGDKPLSLEKGYLHYMEEAYNAH